MRLLSTLGLVFAASVCFYAGSASAQAKGDCQNGTKASPQERRGAAIVGGLLEGLFNFGLRSAGATADSKFRNNFRDFLTEGVACALSDKEQDSAVKATKDALEKGVGSSTTWKSEERTGVSGTTTITGESKTADGQVCRTGKAVVIVDGEETTALETFCKVAGSGTWTRKA